MPAAQSMPGRQVEAAVAAIHGALGPGGIVGVYLFGSAVAGGLRPDSDLDLLVLADHALQRDAKAGLVDSLRPISRRSLRPSEWRPLEVTVVHQGEVRPWRYPPRFELQYGEWLSDEDLGAQVEANATANPDLAVLIAMVRANGHPLIGPPPDEVLDAVPRDDLTRAIRDEVPALLDELEEDMRNVLLTLARAWATVATGAILSKDAAADWALTRLPPPLRPALARARDFYLGGGDGDWGEGMGMARASADALAAEVRRAR